jgi:hypothetical protein
MMLVLGSTFDTQPTVSPKRCSPSEGRVIRLLGHSRGHSNSIVATRTARLTTPVPILRRRLLPGVTALLVEGSRDRLESHLCRSVNAADANRQRGR